MRQDDIDARFNNVVMAMADARTQEEQDASMDAMDKFLEEDKPTAEELKSAGKKIKARTPEEAVVSALTKSHEWALLRAADADKKEQEWWDLLTPEQQRWENPNLDPVWQAKVARWRAQKEAEEKHKLQELKEEAEKKHKEDVKEYKRLEKAFASPRGGLKLQECRERFMTKSIVGKANYDRSRHLRSIEEIKDKKKVYEGELDQLDSRIAEEDPMEEVDAKQSYESRRRIRTRAIECENTRIKFHERKIAEIEVKCPAAVTFDAEFKALGSGDDAEWRALMAEGIDEAIETGRDPALVVRMIKADREADQKAQRHKKKKNNKKKKNKQERIEQPEEKMTFEAMILACVARDNPVLPKRMLASELKEMAQASAEARGFEFDYPERGAGAFTALIRKQGLLQVARKGQPYVFDLDGLKVLPPLPESYKGKSTRLAGDEAKVAEVKVLEPVPTAAPVPSKAASEDVPMASAGSGSAAPLPKPQMPDWVAAKLQETEKQANLVNFLWAIHDNKVEGVSRTKEGFFDDYIAAWRGVKTPLYSFKEFDREASKLIPNNSTEFMLGDYSKVPKAKR